MTVDGSAYRCACVSKWGAKAVLEGVRRSSIPTGLGIIHGVGVGGLLVHTLGGGF